MRIVTVGLILFCVGVSAGAQIALKAGMTTRDIRTVIESGQVARIATTLATSPLVMLGLFSYGLSAIIWMFVLSRVALSTAYPFIALGIAITALVGRYFFHEPMTPMKIAGIGLILAGILVIGLSGDREPVNRATPDHSHTA
ncbi:MAG: EamA family transporter [Sphingomonadales bacterium]|nr:EamA family transporter [Sphingomonadales bacterium]